MLACASESWGVVQGAGWLRSRVRGCRVLVLESSMVGGEGGSGSV